MQPVEAFAPADVGPVAALADAEQAEPVLVPDELVPDG